jgi:hypothetical protein
MKEMALELNPDSSKAQELEEKKKVNIARLNNALENVKLMAKEGIISFDELTADRRRILSELSHWESFTTDIQEVEITLGACIKALNALKSTWGKGDEINEAKNKLVHEIFTHIAYDLDTQRIVAFGLEAWASQYLVVHGALYERTSFGEKHSNKFKGEGTLLPHRRIELLFLP